MKMLGDLRSGAQKQILLTHKRNYRRRNETVPDAGARISINEKIGLLRHHQKYNAALITIFNVRVKWKLIRSHTMELPYFTRCPAPWIAKADDRIPTANSVLPMSKAECWDVCKATKE